MKPANDRSEDAEAAPASQGSSRHDTRPVDPEDLTGDPAEAAQTSSEEAWDTHDERRRKDCFAPPQQACECECLHCGRRFMSDQIWYQKVIGDDENELGFWMCPTPNCGGAGFTFDIFPTDPDHPANAGWQSFDGDEDEEWEEDLLDDAAHASVEEEWDPDEPRYKAMDEICVDDDDLEGEEWKYGLDPGERPTAPDWSEAARREQEEQERRYNEPDRRPREIEMPDRRQPRERSDGASGDDDGSWREDDIPF
jgi:hypothetical protein